MFDLYLDNVEIDVPLKLELNIYLEGVFLNVKMRMQI